MPIWMMTFDASIDPDNPPPDVTVYKNYPGWMSEKPLMLRRTHDGLVLSTGERNGYDDSDFYARVWNPEKGHPETIEYATTRGWTYPNSALVDATPETLAAFAAWEKRTREAAAARRTERDLKVPSVGRTVKVTKGRKVPVGKTGRVFWFGEDRFYRSYGPNFGLFDTLDLVGFGKYRVGLEIDGARVFTNAKNVEVVSA